MPLLPRLPSQYYPPQCHPAFDSFKSLLPDTCRFQAISLLRVSRQLHEEAAPILYSANTFKFFDFDEFESLLARIGARNRSMMQYLELVFTGNKLPLSEEHEYPSNWDHLAMDQLFDGCDFMDKLIGGLELLARGNDLRTVTITLAVFESPLWYTCPALRDMCDLFRRPDARVLDAIWKLRGSRGLKKFRCKRMALIRDTDPDVWDAFQEFWSKMETSSARKVEVEEGAEGKVPEDEYSGGGG